jgi:hypothetical protein
MRPAAMLKCDQSFLFEPRATWYARGPRFFDDLTKVLQVFRYRGGSPSLQNKETLPCARHRAAIFYGS